MTSGLSSSCIKLMATAHLNQPPKQSAVGAFQSSPKWWWAVAEEG